MPSGWIKNGEISEKSFEAENVKVKALVSFSGGEVAKYITIGGEKFIALQDSQLLTDYFYTLKQKSGSAADIGLCVSELSTAIAMVKEGLGVMLLPSSYKKYGTLENELDFYRIRQVSTKRKIAVLYRKDKYINKPMKALIEILVKDV